MPKGIPAVLPLDLGYLINAADTPIADLIEETLVLIEDEIASRLIRQDYWGRLYEKAAKGNVLARHLCERETAYLASRADKLGLLHCNLTRVRLALEAGGHL